MMQVNNDIWQKIYNIIIEKKCTDIELNMIMQEWGQIVEQPTDDVCDHDELYDNVKKRIGFLKDKVGSGENWIIHRCIHALGIASNVSDSDIKQLLEYAYKGGNLKMYDKIFISHSSQDNRYVRALVDFLEDIGLRKDHIFCTSIPQYGVPLGEDFNKRIKEQFTGFNIFVLFVLSDNYYKSVACLNEMGAAWVLQKDYISILLPGFEYEQINGAINPTIIAIKMDDVKEDVEYRLRQFRDNMITLFQLETIEERKWNRCVEMFLKSITNK